MPRSEDPVEPLNCILPPHILKEIARNGTVAQRNRALDAMTLANSVRSLRSTRAFGEKHLQQRLLAQPTAPQKHRTIFDAKGTQNLPGAMVRAEGTSATADPAINEAYDGLGNTFD